MASCPKASSSVRHTKGGRGQGTDDGSRWRCPARPLGFNAVGKNGSAASELAADAYPCIMVWVFGPPHTRMWHDASCTCPQLPSTSSSRSQQVCRVLGALKAKPVGGRPMGGPALTAPARAGDADVRVGAKKRAAMSNKETQGREMDRTLAAPP